jgi:hypothetical protein
MNNLTLYCNCFKEHENLKTQHQVNQKNLMLGAIDLSADYRETLSTKGFYFDDSGDNISSLNQWLGDLTGLYWIWKNTSDEFVGTNQYRRYYSDEHLSSLEYDPKTIYISTPLICQMNLFDQYSYAHSPIGIQILLRAASQNKINISQEHIISVLNEVNVISPANMFFAERKLFDLICARLFEIVFEIYEGTKYALPFIQPPNQYRLVAFLAERILNIMYHNAEFYFGDQVKIKTVMWEQV